MVRSTLTDTYEDLTSKYDGSTGDKPDVVGMKIASAMKYFFPSDEKVESDLSAFQAEYIGLWVSRALIPSAISYYLKNAHLSSSIPAGLNRATPEEVRQYDKVTALQDLDAMIAARIAILSSAFLSSFDQPKSAGIMISTFNDGFVTVDPLTMDPIDSRALRFRVSAGAEEWLALA
jgi:hypothetical protein